MTTSRKYEDRLGRALAAVSAVALAVITLGTFVVVPAWLESNGVDVRMPHVDEAAPRVSAAPSTD